MGDRGFLLSGGQRQRLALLRALLKGSPVFLLDEPTASLDPLAARDLFYRFLDLVEGKSLILITHPPLGLEKMDEILVWEKGREVARGTHRELLSLSPLYRSLWDRASLA